MPFFDKSLSKRQVTSIGPLEGVRVRRCRDGTLTDSIKQRVGDGLEQVREQVEEMYLNVVLIGKKHPDCFSPPARR